MPRGHYKRRKRKHVPQVEIAPTASIPFTDRQFDLLITSIEAISRYKFLPSEVAQVHKILTNPEQT